MFTISFCNSPREGTRLALLEKSRVSFFRTTKHLSLPFVSVLRAARGTMSPQDKQRYSQQDRSPTIRILRKLHTRIETLLDYLQLIADLSSLPSLTTLSATNAGNRAARNEFERYLLRDDDPVVYHELVTKTLVAEIGSVNIRKRLPLRRAECFMPEVRTDISVLKAALKCLRRLSTERTLGFSPEIIGRPMS